MSNLLDATILIDNATGKIIGCNTKAIYLTECNRTALYGLNNSHLFVEELKKSSFKSIDSSPNKNYIAKVETYLITKSGILLPVTISVEDTAYQNDKTVIICTIKATSKNKK